MDDSVSAAEVAATIAAADEIKEEDVRTGSMRMLLMDCSPSGCPFAVRSRSRRLDDRMILYQGGTVETPSPAMLLLSGSGTHSLAMP